MLRSQAYNRLKKRFEEVNKRYMEIVKGAEACNAMLEQYADMKDLIEIRDNLVGIIQDAEDRLSDYNEYDEINSAAIALRDKVERKIYLSRYVSYK